MKTLSGTFAFKLAVLAVVATVAVLTFRAFAQTPSAKATQPSTADQAIFVLKIQKATPVRDEAKFENVLKKLRTQLYQIDVVDQKGNRREIRPSTAQNKLNINTDKVTASEMAGEKGAGPEPSGPRVVQSVSTMYTSDLQDVVNELQ